MNEQNRQRLGRIAKRHATRMARGQGEAEGGEAFLAEFARVRAEVLRPVMEEIGGQLREAGYDFRVVDAESEKKLPAIELRVVIPRREGSKDTIRFFAHDDSQRGWQVIAEIELARSPIELTRFDAGDPITREIVEQLVVDATEQIFASALATPAASARERAASATAPRVPPAADEAKIAGVEASAPITMGETPKPPPQAIEGAEGVRALVLGRMRDGRVLHGLDLVGADLHGLDFTGALMPGLDLQRADLSGCVLAGANLVAARLTGADLTDAVLTGANLSRADLSKAVLAGARFDDAVMVGTIGVPPPPKEVPVPAPEPAPAPPLPADAPARLPIESLPVATPATPVFSTEQPTVLAPPRPPVLARSPLAESAMSLDRPLGGALSFANGSGDMPPLPPAAQPAFASAGDNPPPAPSALPRVQKPPANLATTSRDLNLPIRPALPFAKSAAAAPPPPKPPSPSAGDPKPAPSATPLPQVRKAPPGLADTVSVVGFPVPAALPFAKGAPAEPPPLTVEEYASFRANLTVKGEEDAATWKEFKIASQAMKEALQTRFAARFRDDAEARDRFVGLLQRMVSELRAKAPGR